MRRAKFTIKTSLLMRKESNSVFEYNGQDALKFIDNEKLSRVVNFFQYKGLSPFHQLLSFIMPVSITQNF